MRETETHCPYCGLQCGMTLVEDDDGAFSVAARDFPTNRGGLCRKGWTSASLLAHPDRLTTPMLRRDKGAPLRPATWDEALDFAARAIERVQKAHGRDALAIMGGGALTNEKAYLLGKFARVAVATANVDYNGRFCMATGAIAGSRAFGVDRGLPFPLSDLADAETIMIVGGNPAETMPPIMRWFDAQRDNGGKLIVVDPRRTPTAARADLHLQLTPGTDAALALGLLNVAITDRLIDTGFIADRTVGFEEVHRLARAWWPDRAERVTGVPAAKIRDAAHLVGEAASAVILSGRGCEQQSHGVDNALAFINLALALGKVGRRGSGWACVTGQGNGQGGREHGQKADQLPGYRKLADPADRAAVAAIWGVDPDSLPGPGLTASELLGRLGSGGSIRGLMIMGSNVVVSAPDTGRLRERLKAIDVLIVADFFLSDTAMLADVVFPVTQWAEEAGTTTNLEGRVIRRRQAKRPPDGVRTDSEVLVALADRLGRADAFGRYSSPDEIFDELRRASAGGTADYAGISYDRIVAEEGVFWPCPDPGHPGTPRLFLDRFWFPDGRARFSPVVPGEPAETPDSRHPYYLTSGRVLAQYQTGTQTHRVNELNAAEPGPFVEIHPETARTLKIEAGDLVDVTTHRGTARVVARLSRDIRLDTLFIPFHWAGRGNVNILTNNDALDPVSRIPEFKICAASLRRVEDAASGTVLEEGAGS